jgi:hypothetical protein
VDPSGFTPVEVSGRVPELQQVALTSSAGPRFSKWLNDTMNAPAQWLGEKLSQFLPLDIWDYIEKLKIFAETEAMRAKFYAQMDIIVDDAAGLIDQGFSIDEALNIATRKVGTPVDVIETEKLKILFAGYPTLTSVAQIKAELKRPH